MFKLKLPSNGVVFLLYSLYLLRMRCFIHCTAVEHGRRDASPYIELDKQASESSSSLKQYPSSDIVAQFTLPPIVIGSFGTVGGTSTSTLANFANRSNAASSGSGYSVESKNYFTHLTFDHAHNVMYAGATNKILKLNENLRVLSEAVTGPKHDAPQCHAGGCPEDVETALVNNFNKILVVSYAHNDGILISCGSIRQGNYLYVSINFCPY